MFVRQEAIQHIETSGEVLSCKEVSEVRAQLVVVVVVESLDGGVLDCAVHPLELAVER